MSLEYETASESLNISVKFEGFGVRVAGLVVSLNLRLKHPFRTCNESKEEEEEDV